MTALPPNTQPTNLTQWLQNLPIPWAASNKVGHADATAQGTVYDQQVSLAKQAVLARYPDYAPADALPYLGKDRQLIQGYNESDDDFRIRCRTVWDQWELAGTWAELLFQLFWSAGLSTASTAIVQQNGYAYTLSADPGPDDDPLNTLVVTPLGNNPTITYPTGIPWWTFDQRTDLCSRFGIIVSGTMPGTLQITGRATFNGTSRATATWSGPFDGPFPSYSVLVSTPVTTDGSVVTVSADSASGTSSTMDVVSSAPFTGYVDLLGWRGSNPFTGPSLQTLNIIKKVVSTWRPAKATYQGLWVVIDGAVWGWPVSTKWGQSGLRWGQGTSAFFGP
jgi:hypothetical protein